MNDVNDAAEQGSGGERPDGERPREKQRGPVVLRRQQRNESSTTDQRLLDSRGHTDWVHTDPWRVLRIQSEFVEGFGALAELGPAISIFGSARLGEDHPDYECARRIGAGIAERGYGCFAEWVSDTSRLLERCPCRTGCPSCVQSPKCGNLNEFLDKAAARTLLARMTEGR